VLAHTPPVIYTVYGRWEQSTPLCWTSNRWTQRSAPSTTACASGPKLTSHASPSIAGRRGGVLRGGASPGSNRLGSGRQHGDAFWQCERSRRYDGRRPGGLDAV